MTINVRTSIVKIDSIEPHPSNPRLGDVAAIADSLRVNGQFSPLVVWGTTIIAGTHTWRAAKSLGWKEVAVTEFTGTEDEALRVLLTDNRTSDLASYNNMYLLDLLKSLPTLDGTGYQMSDIDELEGLFNEEGGGVEKAAADDDEEPVAKNPLLRFGNVFTGPMDPVLYNIWVASVQAQVGEKKAKVIAEIRARLDLPTGDRAPRRQKHQGETRLSMGDVETIPLNTLVRYPGNPREGDVGAISESLRTLGQYRPLIVNRRNNQILKGNHTAAAASSLGWTEIAVAWVDVDEEEAARIVLVDNRTSSLGTYDTDLLASIVKKVKSLDGTGFDADDIDTMNRGGDVNPNAAKVKFQVGEYRFTVVEGVFQTWLQETDLPTDAVARLDMPTGTLLADGD